MNKQLALAIVNGLSEPSKMPCYGWSIPAQRCNTGQKLRKVPGSVCSTCYALRGHYMYKVVQACLERRYQAMLNHPQWVEAMVWLINNVEKSGYFRWFDSGDVPSVEGLDKIVQVVKQTPGVQHWLPTREYGFVSAWFAANGAFPANLTLRLSALKFEAAPPVSVANRLGVLTSTASKTNYNCPAYAQKGKCLDCRACWDKNVPNVSYKRH